MDTLKVDEKQRQNIFRKMEKALPKWLDMIDRSFLSDAFKLQFKAIIHERIDRLKWGNTPDSSGKPAGCAAPEDLERIAGIGPKQKEKENGNENE